MAALAKFGHKCNLLVARRDGGVYVTGDSKGVDYWEAREQQLTDYSNAVHGQMSAPAAVPSAVTKSAEAEKTYLRRQVQIVFNEAYSKYQG